VQDETFFYSLDALDVGVNIFEYFLRAADFLEKFNCHDFCIFQAFWRHEMRLVVHDHHGRPWGVLQTVALGFYSEYVGVRDILHGPEPVFECLLIEGFHLDANYVVHHSGGHDLGVQKKYPERNCDFAQLLLLFFVKGF
jgi:hypothetical protein